MLTNNRLSNLESIDEISNSCPEIERLSLVGNLISNLPNYRLYTIFKLKNLKVLDFQKVT